MFIVNQKITKAELQDMASAYFGDMVKGVVG